MNRFEQVKEFMVTMQQPVAETPITLSVDRNELRIALIFEELKEYAEASGLPYYFEKLCSKYSLEVHVATQIGPLTTIVNQTEQFDALLDLEYVLLGAVHEHGFGNIFQKGFDNVHASNMSKVCTTEKEALATIEKYEKENVSCYFKQVGKYFVVYNRNNDKVLKSINYTPAVLAPIIIEGSNHK